MKLLTKEMNKELHILFISLSIILCSCSGIDCEELPESYSNYEVAINTIKATHFKIQETINTTKSSWIRGASYYSCDGSSGFFILKTSHQEYLYSNVPVDKWNNFKSSDSFGSYFNHNIKNKFSFKLNQ